MEANASDLDRLVPGLDDIRRERLMALRDLYAEWNAKLNLISRKDFDAFPERHLLHSLSIVPYLEPRAGQTAVDIGTGGGFPGIPLAIVFPEIEFTLVDSIGKKIKAVQAIADEIGLTNVRTIQARAENVTGQYDYALSRAVARLSVLVRYCIGCSMKVGRLYCLKGGDLREEIAEVRRHPIQVYDLKDRLEGEFFETKKLVVVDFQGRRLSKP